MFRSSTIIRELALNVAKVTFTLKHTVKLYKYHCSHLGWGGHVKTQLNFTKFIMLMTGRADVTVTVTVTVRC